MPEPSPTRRSSPPVAELNDETLRDGLQSPSIRHPTRAQKLRMLELMETLGVRAASVGLPGAGPDQAEDAEALLRALVARGSTLEAHCAARTKVEDLRPIAEIAQRVGAPLGAYTFIGSSPIRRFAEGWTIDHLLRSTEVALAFAEREGIPIAFVTEDTTRSRPAELEQLFRHAIGLGARRLVLCDTVGHATPEGTSRLVRFTREVIRACGETVRVDWHGHDDRGLAVANALAAEAAGADRLHGTMLGIGERCGNAAIDQLLRCQAQRGGARADPAALVAYRELVVEACDWPLAPSYPS